LFQFKPDLTKDKAGKKAKSVEAHRVGAANRFRKKSAAAREIAPDFPGVKHPKKREKSLASLEYFCKTCLAEVFFLEFSNDHRRVIARIETAVAIGGAFALAMPRGSGKSALCAAAVLWASLKGLHPFSLIIGATEDAAVELLAGIKMQLETNDVLLDLFPEVCYPIRRLEGVAQRRLLWNGQLVRMKFTARHIELPNMPPSSASSACIGVAGLTGRVRGRKFTRPDGSEVRPSFVMVDDPQTDESAKSPSQCADRESLIKGSVMGLAGPGSKIAIVVPCTVVVNDDLASRLLDREANPEFVGERTRMLNSLPKNEKLWEQYLIERNKGLTEDGSVERGNAFYRENFVAMNDGAEASWPARHRPDELSAIQCAMNIKLTRPHAFAAEYQQEPIDDEAAEQKPSLHGIRERLNQAKRFELPQWGQKTVAFVDVQARALFYVVMSFADDYTGAIVDYGAEPDEGRPYFAYRDKRRTLEMSLAAAGKTGGEEAAIWHGLDVLTDRLLGRPWHREEGAELRIDRCLIDSGYQSDTVYEYCRRSPYAAVLMPSKGVGIRAGDIPMSEYKPRPGERPGFHTITTTDLTKRTVRLLKFDSNFWKTFVAQRLRTLARGSVSVFGTEPDAHRMLADNMESEFCEKTFGRGRTVWEWRCPPGRDNHLLDGIVGCYAAGSTLGLRLPENTTQPKPRPQSQSNGIRINLTGQDGRSFFVTNR
jgi:hypothetical protein